MAKKTIGAGLKLDGEQEFKRALSDINKNLSVLGSELRKVSVENENNTDTVKQASETNTVLSKKMDEQREKIKLIRQALSESKEKYGENSKQVKNWQIGLNKAETELARMTNSFEKNNEIIVENGKSFLSVGDVIRSVTGVIGLEMNPVVETMATRLDGVSASAGGLVLVLGGITTALAKTTMETARTADELKTLSTQSGVSVETLQGFKYAEEFIDVPLERMTDALSKTSKAMYDTSIGSGEAKIALEELNVSVTSNGRTLKDSESAFYEIIDALKQVPDETKRNALAMRIFGESAKDLNPLIEAGSGQLKTLKKEAEDMGYVMSGKTVDSMVGLSDAMEKMSKQGDAIKRSFALALMPVLTALFEVISSIPTEVLTLLITLGGTITTIVLVVKAMNEMTSAFKGIKNVFGAFDSQTKQTTILILDLVAAIAAVVVGIVALKGKSGEFQAAMSQINGTTARQQIPAYAVDGSHANGLDYVPYDGYVAELHKGEKVLTAEENAKGNSSQTVNVYVQGKDLDQMSKIVKLFEQLKQTKNAGEVVMT